VKKAAPVPNEREAEWCLRNAAVSCIKNAFRKRFAGQVRTRWLPHRLRAAEGVSLLKILRQNLFTTIATVFMLMAIAPAGWGTTLAETFSQFMAENDQRQMVEGHREYLRSITNARWKRVYLAYETIKASTQRTGVDSEKSKDAAVTREESGSSVRRSLAQPFAEVPYIAKASGVFVSDLFARAHTHFALRKWSAEAV